MTRSISPEKLKQLSWLDQSAAASTTSKATATTVAPAVTSSTKPTRNVDELLKGTAFYNDSLPAAYRAALEHAGSDGLVLTMPELIAAKANTTRSHKYWTEWYTTNTEENIGLDTKGLYYTRNVPVLVLIHGGGLLTPDRIDKAYTDGLINGSAKYTSEEFDQLLEGKLSDGTTIPIYPFEDIAKGIPTLHQFGIVMPYAIAQDTQSGYFKKKKFVENPLVIARAGSSEHLEKYHDLAKGSDKEVGNHHPFSGRDPAQPQGRLLFLINVNGGLIGYGNLNGCGRFVGVAPEAPRARRRTTRF